MDPSKRAQTVQASQVTALTPPIASTLAAADVRRPIRSSQPSKIPDIVCTKESETARINTEQPRRASINQKTDDAPSSTHQSARCPDSHLWEQLLRATRREAASWVDRVEIVELGFKRHIRHLEQEISTLTKQNSRLADQLKLSKESERKYARSAELYSADLGALRPLVKLYDDYTKVSRIFSKSR